MPGFPTGAAERLADALEAVDAQPGDLDEPPLSAAGTEDGLELIGTAGMSCVTCHDIHVHPAPGISTIDLATAYDRLRPGWVFRFLRDPAALRPGTRMPAYWPEGEANFPHLGGGTTKGQIDALWGFLSLGASMPTPEGMDIGSELVLVPDQRPLVFRTHMIDVGPRAIAIGYPENVHAAFDANTVRLAKVWRGAFFDAKGTWQGRAGQFFGPYGTDVLNLPTGPAFAVLDDIDSPWPATGRYDRNVGGRFLGYRLDDLGRPALRYRLGDVLIEETPTAPAWSRRREPGSPLPARRRPGSPTRSSCCWQRARRSCPARSATGRWTARSRSPSPQKKTSPRSSATPRASGNSCNGSSSSRTAASTWR